MIQKAAMGSKSPNPYEIKNPIEIPIGQGIVGSVALDSKSIIVNDTSKDSRYIVDDKARSSEISIPILHEGKVIGVIDSEHSKKNFYTDDHQKEPHYFVYDLWCQNIQSTSAGSYEKN